MCGTCEDRGGSNNGASGESEFLDDQIFSEAPNWASFAAVAWLYILEFSLVDTSRGWFKAF